jgi:hypothetical protein
MKGPFRFAGAALFRAERCFRLTDELLPPVRALPYQRLWQDGTMHG